ncbi:hypothetical protein NliqN6_4052 [Naganishia liquefaciens]|uniref:Thiolase family protein n=1 Tax=Naganishia liquefaciens TaxID=104408 RepID=A0A8H3TUU9_9TREE|nr:hypothetical protein NliqN6_4052 [Naganishia liquefaciens]
MPRLALAPTPAINAIRARGLATSSVRQSLESIRQKNRDDVVITFAKRTALTRAKKGAFRDTSSDTLLYSLLQKGMDQSGVDRNIVGDIIAGVCHTPSPAYEVRAASLAAGFPETTPAEAINRLCSSGLMAIRHVSDSIARGDLEVGVAVGYESMSSHPRPTPVFGSEAIRQNAASVDCAKPMGWTSEMLALDYNISRERQDEYGLVSHTRASAAQQAGKFQDEIIPITTSVLADPKDANSERQEIIADKDDGIRHGLTMDKLRAAKPAFKDYGDARSTGPNSSQVTDGAAMVVMMPRWKAEELGLPILAKHVTTSVVGCKPRVMGIGPVYAIPKVLQRAGITKDEVDLIELNEAFGSMYAYCVETLGLDNEKVNVNGGAIALGHPLGCTGVRQVVTGLAELKRRGGEGQVLLTSMCVGAGMGAAGIFVT